MFKIKIKRSVLHISPLGFARSGAFMRKLPKKELSKNSMPFGLTMEAKHFSRKPLIHGPYIFFLNVMTLRLMPFSKNAMSKSCSLDKKKVLMTEIIMLMIFIASKYDLINSDFC